MEKDAARTRMKKASKVDPGKSFLVVSGLFVWLSGRLPGTTSAFLAMPDEVDVTPLFERFPGWRWVLPRVEGDRSLTFRDRDIPTETHPYGMEQPVNQGPVVPISEIDVFLVPGLAFDRSGGRLGRGGGYYDQILTQRRGDSVPVGVTVLERVVDAVPMHDHDQRVKWIAAEDGVTECSPRT